jgi:hypothetical protein
VAFGFVSAARAHWKSFVWIWTYPIVLFGSILVPAFGKSPQLVFFAFDVPLFFIAGHIAMRPMRDRQVSLVDGFLLVFIVPVFVWAALIFGLLGLTVLLKHLVK